MDVKKAIASGIQQHLLNGVPLDRSEPIQELEGVNGVDCGIEVQAVSPLETQIRVKTVGNGTRYFTVKVTES